MEDDNQSNRGTQLVTLFLLMPEEVPRDIYGEIVKLLHGFPLSVSQKQVPTRHDPKGNQEKIA